MRLTRSPSLLRAGSGLAAVTLAMALAACDAGGGGTAEPGSSAGPTGVATSGANPPGGGSTPGVSVRVPSGSGSAQPTTGRLTGADVVISGRQGSVSWRIAIPQFTGTPAAAEISRRVRASAQSAIDTAKREARDDDGTRRKLTGAGTITTNDGRTVQVVIKLTDDLAGTAHPLYAVNTVAVTADTGAPILFAQLFASERKAFPVLAAQIRRLAANEGNPVTEPDGIAPREANWAAWQTSVYGMRFYFQDYQLGGHGLRSYLLPWPTVNSLLSPTAQRLLAPV